MWQALRSSRSIMGARTVRLLDAVATRITHPSQRSRERKLALTRVRPLERTKLRRSKRAIFSLDTTGLLTTQIQMEAISLLMQSDRNGIPFRKIHRIRNYLKRIGVLATLRASKASSHRIIMTSRIEATPMMGRIRSVDSNS